MTHLFVIDTPIHIGATLNALAASLTERNTATRQTNASRICNVIRFATTVHWESDIAPDSVHFSTLLWCWL